MFGVSAGRQGCVRLLRCWPVTLSPTTPTTPRCPLHASRFFSISAPPKSHKHEVIPPLRRWALEVSPFSTVRAQLGCSISVGPLDPHSFPEADRAFVSVLGTGSAEEEAHLEHLQVRYDEQSKELLIITETENSSLSIDVYAPIKSNILITAKGKGSVQVKKMECDICNVQTERGDCLLHSIRSHHVTVRSQGGHITGAGTIHGNVDISACGDSTVDVKKLQGTRMNVSTEHGALKVKAIYAESSSVSSCSGRVELGHVHGNATVKNESGDIVIDGSNSVLKVSSHSGNIDVYVGDGGSAELLSQEGAVCVRVPSSLKAGVELCGASVDVSPEVALHGAQNNTSDGQTTVTGYINAESAVEQRVRAQTDRGTVTLKTQSWFESLKLGG